LPPPHPRGTFKEVCMPNAHTGPRSPLDELVDGLVGELTSAARAELDRRRVERTLGFAVVELMNGHRQCAELALSLLPGNLLAQAVPAAAALSVLAADITARPAAPAAAVQLCLSCGRTRDASAPACPCRNRAAAADS
jgi:hypothetical protein